MWHKAKKIFFSLSKNERIVFIVAAFFVVASTIVLTSIFIKTATQVVAASGGTYIEGMVGQPSFVNPVLAQSEVDKTLVHLIFSNLKDLASKIESSEDGRVWRVRLKDDIFWHNGEKLTSDDIIFTIQKIQNPDTRSPLFSAWQGIFVQRLSEREVQFNLGAPYVFFETSHIQSLYILPKHLFADIPSANWRLSEFNLRPVGSGPYVFRSYEAAKTGFIDSYELAANSRYSGEKAFIETFILRLFPQEEELIKAFNAGQIDGFGSSYQKKNEGGTINRSHALVPFPMPSYYAVFINQNQHIALKEKEVRRAMELAVAKQELVKNVLNDYGVSRESPFPEEAFGEATEGEAHFSAGDARALLEGAGWILNQEGIREKKIKDTVITLSFSLTVPEMSPLIQTAHALRAAWETIGIRTDIKILPLEEVAENKVKSRDYQLLLFGNILPTSFDAFSFWHSSERFHPGSNLSLYENKSADTLIEAIREEFDPAKRVEKFKELKEIIVSDAPAIFLYSPHYLYATDNNIKGVKKEMISEPAARFDNIEAWHLKTRRVLQ